MLLFLLQLTGWLTAHTPEFLLRGIAVALGDFIFVLMPRRRRLVLSNLHHAFSERPAAWRVATGRESCRRLIETALLSLATPYLGERRFREIIAGAPELHALFAGHARAPHATLICSPHIAYWEAQTAMPLILPGPFPEFGIIFRPLDHDSANAFVKTSRERFGMKLLSRKEGFAEALKILRRAGFVGVLFDQNAGMQGALTTLFGRVCSTTELPGLMAEKFSARVYGIFPRRLGFWRIEIGVEQIPSGVGGDAVTIGLNRWLEQLLAGDDNLCASWLWAHDRWRNQDLPARRLRLEAKRNLLATELDCRGGAGSPSRPGFDRHASAEVQAASEKWPHLPALPRRTRIWIRLPNWLGDVVMALPLLRAIRAGRPDAEITLVAKQPFLPLLELWSVADKLHALPPQDARYFRHFRALRPAYPDVWLLFTNSLRGDGEAWLAGAPQRFGLVRPGRPRPLLTHAYPVPRDFDEHTHPQLELWENFLRHFGLVQPIDRSALELPLADPPSAIALIPGSENTPEKRWPITHWRALIEALPDESFALYGTANDAPITGAVAAGFNPERVRDFAGKTDLMTFARALRSSRALVTNDSGGMHLANALGVPLIALFGPTNPLRTGPVFATPAIILQPPRCPPTGGGSLADLHPETVLAALRDHLAAVRAQAAASLPPLPL